MSPPKHHHHHGNQESKQPLLEQENSSNGNDNSTPYTSLQSLEKKNTKLDDILASEQAKSTEFLIYREKIVRTLWWILFIINFVYTASFITSWRLYYEPNITFTHDGIINAIKNYSYKFNLYDTLFFTSLRTLLTFASLFATFSDENRIIVLNSISYWFSVLTLILSISKAMIISWVLDPNGLDTTGTRIYRIIMSLGTVFISFAIVLMHRKFNPLDIKMFEDDEFQQQEYLKRQKLHHQQQEQAQITATELTGQELQEFLKEQEQITLQYEAVEIQLKRARMAAKQMEDGTSLLEFLWLLKPYFWPTGLFNKSIVFLTWAVLIASKISSIMAPIQIGHAADHLQEHHTIPWKAIILFCSFTFLTSGLKQLQNVIYLKVKQQAFVELSKNCLEHILSLSLSWHHSKTLGKTTRSIDRGLSAAESVVQYLFLMLLPSAFEALTIFILFFNKFKQPLISSIIFFHLAVYCIATIQLTILRKPMRQKARAMDNKYHDILTDALQNIEVVKVFDKTQYEVHRYTEAIKYYQSSTIFTQATLASLNALQSLIIQVCLCLCLFVISNDIANGTLTIGALSSLVAFMGNLFQPLTWLGSIYDAVIQSLIDASAILEIQRLQPEVIEYKNAAPLKFTQEAPLIEFKNVTFAYDEKSGRGVKNLNLTVQRGERLAIIGKTGSGKSTITRLLLRFYDPQSGQILINGQDIRYCTNSSLKQAIIICPQDTSLFNDTILNNIIYPNPNATHDEIIKACAFAGILDFILSLPLTFHQVVGEKGQKLSGGEKQRLVICRSLIRRFSGANGSNINDPEANALLRINSILSTSDSTSHIANETGGINTNDTHNIDINQRAIQYTQTNEYEQDKKTAQELLGVGRIILTDEINSALDSLVARSVQAAMKVLEENATTISITHSLTHITHYDRIIVMGEGEILEQGSHEELLAKNGIYSLMYAQQFVQEKITDIDSHELSATLEHVKQFSTNSIFSNKNNTSKNKTIDSNNNSLSIEVVDDSNNNTSSTAPSTNSTTPLETPVNNNNNVSTPSNALQQFQSQERSVEESIEEAKKALAMGALYNKIAKNNLTGNTAGRGGRGHR